KIELPLIEPKRDRELEFVRGVAAKKRMVNGPVIVQIGAVAIDRLLEIADHAKMAGLRRRGLGFQPAASRIGRASDLRKDGELRGIGVLRFVQYDVEVFFAQAPGRSRMLKQFIREGDLIGISDQAALDPEIAEIALHFGGNAERGLRHPRAQVYERLIPAL